MDKIRESLRLRQQIQDECFGGVPDEPHRRAIEELEDALQSCIDLLKLADSLNDDQKKKLLPPDW